jgi:MoxR-vWA-beta-propeller ternary system domain bpX2
MLAHFVDVCCASLPLSGLAALAEVRAVPGVMVLCQATRIWVRWEAGDEGVLQRVFPVPGVVLYSFRGGHWYRLGGHLPAFDVVAEGDFQPLHAVLFPAPVQPVAPRAGPWSQITLALRPNAQPRRTTAMICSIQQFMAWADAIPSCRLTALNAARNGASIFILGPRLPLLASSQRLWGDSVLKPLGSCLEPDLPEPIVRECVKLAEDELLIITERGADVLCRSDLRPLNRARLRLAMREAAS